MDYLKKLDDTELEYLNKFMAEYVSGAFKKDEVGNFSEDNFHATVEDRRECYTRNNIRNRCGLTIANATGNTIRMDNVESFIDNLTDFDAMQSSVHELSDEVYDLYGGDYGGIEAHIEQEQWQDYLKCLNPRNKEERVMAESEYGKMLKDRFKNTKLE